MATVPGSVIGYTHFPADDPEDQNVARDRTTAYESRRRLAYRTARVMAANGMLQADMNESSLNAAVRFVQTQTDLTEDEAREGVERARNFLRYGNADGPPAQVHGHWVLMGEWEEQPLGILSASADDPVPTPSLRPIIQAAQRDQIIADARRQMREPRVPTPAPRPAAPQSFERPKRRIRLE